MKAFILIIFSLITIGLNSQTKKIQGVVLNAETNLPISWVEVYEEIARERVMTNDSGYFEIKTYPWEGIRLKFHQMGFHDFEYVLSKTDIETKNLILKIKLIPDTEELSEVQIYFQKIDTIFRSNDYSVADFEFMGDRMLFLAYDKRVEVKDVLLLTDYKNLIYHEVKLPHKADKIERDFQGEVIIHSADHIYGVRIKNDRIKLLEYPKADFLQQIEPVEDSIKNKLYFSDYRWDYPKFKYLTFDTLSNSIDTIHEVEDKDLSKLYHFEYYELTSRERVYVRKLETETGVSRHIIAAQLTGFIHSLYYRPLYAPLYKENDTINIFDHYENKIFKYVADDSLPKKVVDIDYHLVKNWRTWENQLIQDQLNPRFFYAVFLIKNHYYLKKIDGRDGQIKAVYRLEQKYVENITVRGGFAYYIYRPFESTQKKFLYREVLQ